MSTTPETAPVPSNGAVPYHHRHEECLPDVQLCSGYGSCVPCAGAREHVHNSNGHVAKKKAARDSCTGSSGCDGACSPPPDDVSAGTFDLGFSRDGRSDPQKDVVLRIEAETEEETKVPHPTMVPQCLAICRFALNSYHS